MNYRRFLPPDGQQDYVEHYWRVQAPDHPAPVREILIPNGRPTLLISLAAPGTRLDPLTETRTSNGNLLFGITTRPFVLEQQTASDYIGVQFHPYALATLLPSARLLNQFLPLEQGVGQADSNVLLNTLAMTEEGDAAIDVVARFVQARLTPLDADTLGRLRAAIACIEDTRGLCRVREVARYVSVSASALYRLFKVYVGISPKQFIDITRYYLFVGQLLGDTPRESHAVLAALQGYYDQSHAAKEFRRFTGVSPQVFQTNLNGIARLMHSKHSHDFYNTAALA